MYMYFSTSINKHCGLPVKYLGNCECHFVNEVKYLGVKIHSSMKTTIDVTRQTRKFYMQADLLLRNFRHCSDDVKCFLFQTYCTNMYCCQLWFNLTKSSIKKLSTSYNSVLRRLLCISKPYSASNMFISRADNVDLQNFCINLFIDLQNKLKLVQILSLQPVYPHCYIFHPQYVNGGVLYFMKISLRNACMY